MAHHILVIEYEPRYIQRIEEAAADGGLSTTVARTGDEAIQSLPKGSYDLIVLSTIIPRYSTAQLIRSIRNDSTNSSTPVLLTTSGYSGTDPRSDAMKIGATDMLIKPYAPADFIQKVRSVLNLPSAGNEGDDESSAETVRFSSKQIFGDLLDEVRPAPTLAQQVPPEADETIRIQKMMPPARSDASSEAESSEEKRRRKASDDVDRMLKDTLAGVKLPSARKKKKSTAADDLDKLLENTLSGLEPHRSREQRSPGGKSLKQESAGSVPEGGDEPPESPEPPVAVAPLLESSAEEPAGEPGDVEEDPFPELPDEQSRAIEPEQDEPPFEGVGERADEQDGAGTTLIREEDPSEHLPPAAEAAGPDDFGHFGQYVLLEKIATGGMAEVWKARMRGLEGFEKIVAIKKILPHLSDNSEFIDMFVDEAKLAAQLSHNNIIHIYDLGKIDGSWFIAMEYNDGYDLKSLLTKGRESGRPLPVPLGLFIASKIASALDYAHRKRGFDDQELGVVHRDVSPQNVLISREGDIKICDFGIAKAATKASHTQAGALKGKLQYMSPEQAWGRHLDHRSDIFATAAVLFEMIAGRKLFSGESELSVLDQVREARVPAPSTYNEEVSSRIDEVVLKGLEKDPGARFSTAGEMAKAIDGILSDYKPAPSSADLAFYITAIENPESHPMPSAPVVGLREPQEDAEPDDQAAGVPVEESSEAELPVPVPVPKQPTEPYSPMVEPPDSDETIPVMGKPPLDDYQQTPADPEPPVFASLDSEPPKRRSRAVPIAIAVILILAVVAGGAVVLMRQDTGGGPEGDVAAGLGANAPGAVPVVPDAGRDDIATPVVDGAVTEDALNEEQLLGEMTAEELGEEDLAMIEEAVRSRIEAERARLESQRPEAEPPARNESSIPAAPQTSRPPPTPPQQQSQTAPEPAVTPPSTPPSTPPADATPPSSSDATRESANPSAPQQAAPAQQPPAAPATPAVRRGQMVEPGTPGLVDPQLVSLRKIAYPPLARRNKVGGLVIIRALISEEGKVLETELLRGVSQNVGLNEAALEMVRGGTFRPAKLENVAVRAWKTIPIPFKVE